MGVAAAATTIYLHISTEVDLLVQFTVFSAGKTKAFLFEAPLVESF
jgi:hypothetical protein